MKESERELISVIIPTYNRRGMISDAIDSVLAQTYECIEIIVVDDGSTDNTSELLQKKYRNKIILIRREHRSNSAIARNEGTRYSKGTYLSFLDSDDVWLPQKLEKQYEIISKDQNIALVGGGCKYIGLDGDLLDTPATLPPKDFCYESFCIRVELPGSGSNNLIRKSAFQSVSGFDEKLVRAEDMDLWIRLIEKYKVGFTDCPVALIRLHDTPRIGVDQDVILESRKRIINKIEKREVRRKARSYMFFAMAMRTVSSDLLSSIQYFIKSMITHPMYLGYKIKRIRPYLSAIRGEVFD